MQRIEAVIFASAEPVSRGTLARVVGKDCSIDLLIDDLVEELRDRPYELVSVAGGWQHRTRSRFAETIRASLAPTSGGAAALSEFEAMVLIAARYFQPVTRSELSEIFGREVSRDTVATLRGAGFLSSGPRSPTPGAPYTYVTTQHILSVFGMETLRDLPDVEALEDAGLLGRKLVEDDSLASEVERANRYDPHIRAVRLSSESEGLLDDWLVQSRLTFTAGSVFSNLPMRHELDRYRPRDRPVQREKAFRDL